MMIGWFLTYEENGFCYRLKERKFQELGRKFLRQEFQKPPNWVAVLWSTCKFLSPAVSYSLLIHFLSSHKN